MHYTITRKWISGSFPHSSAVVDAVPTFAPDGGAAPYTLPLPSWKNNAT